MSRGFNDFHVYAEDRLKCSVKDTAGNFYQVV